MEVLRFKKIINVVLTYHDCIFLNYSIKIKTNNGQVIAQR